MDEIRTCDECGKVMTEGFCLDQGIEYYCTEECLHKHYTEEEREEIYDNGDGYRTEREDEFTSSN